MKTALYYLTLFVIPCAALAACSVSADEDLFSTSDPIVCDTDADCPAGLECELEHGDSFCKPHGGDDGDGGSTGTSTSSDPNDCVTDADCPAGLECEIEHGVSFCKPHGGDDGGGASGGAGAAECASDADCPLGQECEEEHGEFFCKPHGGN